MSSSLMSSPVRVNPSGTGSPGFRSQKRLSAGTIIKKIETLEGAIESLRQQLVFSRSEEEQISNTISKRKTNTNPKQPKEPKETKAKEPKEPKEPKETKASAEEKDKIPMPWTGIADFAACVGLKAQYGLFIQCGKACNATSGSFQIDNHECRFCNECTKKCDENGKHPVGTIEERIEAGVGKYVNDKTGKKETAYIEVLEKMGITKEQALESAAKRGLQIPDWMLEKPEKKRGRPGKNAENVASESIVEKQEKQEKQEKPKKEPKQKQPSRSKKTASVATFDTPQKVSTTKDSAQSSVCVDLNDTAVVAVVAAVAAAPQEKKKRGRPTKSNTENNVDMDEMQQLIVQATTEKKKRLSLDTEVMASDESENSIHPETQLFNGQENKSEDVESDEVFEMFDEMIRNEEQEQQVVKEVVKEAAKEDAKKKKGSEEAAAIKEAAKEAAKKKKEEEAAAKEAVKEAAKKKKEEEAAAKEAAKEAAKKKKDEEASAKEAAKEAAKKKKESEEAAKKKQEEESEETDEEYEDDDEELECEEYEYEGETYGLAPNGDIYSQDGDLVGKLTNGVTKMFD